MGCNRHRASCLGLMSGFCGLHLRSFKGSFRRCPLFGDCARHSSWSTQVVTAQHFHVCVFTSCCVYGFLAPSPTDAPSA
eukprot:13754112-Alexandrium_andersonii.AAC.1